MMGHTHGLIGAAVGLGVATVYHLTPEASLMLAGLAGGLALLPDIDHPHSKMRQKMGVVGHVGLFWLKHRGITHTLIALVAVAAAAYMLLPLPYAVGAAGGYLSHLLADMMTVSGLPILWPYKRESLHLLPKRLRLTTNTLPEHLLAGLLMVFLVWQVPQILG